ncbi:hypothetical protein BLOT_010429 [Blomia tropicalis]|nr:hypothetical protein BLOT_010429 [Blomia tropicalis]
METIISQYIILLLFIIWSIGLIIKDSSEILALANGYQNRKVNQHEMEINNNYNNGENDDGNIGYQSSLINYNIRVQLKYNHSQWGQLYDPQSASIFLDDRFTLQCDLILTTKNTNNHTNNDIENEESLTESEIESNDIVDENIVQSATNHSSMNITLIWYFQSENVHQRNRLENTDRIKMVLKSKDLTKKSVHCTSILSIDPVVDTDRGFYICTAAAVSNDENVDQDIVDSLGQTMNRTILLRVRDMKATIWPLIGVLVQFLLVWMIIMLCNDVIVD